MQYLLNELYNQYKNGIITKNTLECGIYNYCLNNQKKTCCCRWKKDAYEDFLSWLFTRLKNMIEKYTYKGYSFQTYFFNFFKIASNEYKIRKMTKNINEYTALSACLPDLFVNEELPGYLCENNEKIISKILNSAYSKKNPRRVLALIIKCYCYISDEFIEKAAPIINIDKDELKKMIEKIRSLRQKKDDKIYLMKEKLYSKYYKCIALERKLKLINENTTEYIMLKRKLENTRMHYNKLKIRLKKTKTDAANSQIAEVIGVSKGCVDSSLFKLKQKFDLN